MATVWAFNKVSNEFERELLYNSIKSGKSRFGWSQNDEHNLALKDNWSEHHSKQLFLLQVCPGDWIVHINTPYWGRCIAAQVTSGYNFDEGLECKQRIDFRHCFDIDTKTIMEFDRRDPNILPSVNLNPRQRYHRVRAFDDFIRSIENLKNKKVNLGDSESSGEYHLKEETNKYLAEIASHIHNMHRSKKLEKFLAKVFQRIPSVTHVKENGSGRGTDHGADLIVITSSALGNLSLEHVIIVQVKSYQGEHHSLEALNQIKTGIKEYGGTAGMIITTATASEQLENEIQQFNDNNVTPIDLLAADDVAKFVIKHAPDLIFRLDGIA